MNNKSRDKIHTITKYLTLEGKNAGLDDIEKQIWLARSDSMSLHSLSSFSPLGYGFPILVQHNMTV